MIDKIKHEREKRSLIVHARSSFLQGLLCSKDDSKWKIAGVDNPVNIVMVETNTSGTKMSIAVFALVMLTHKWIDSVIIGVDKEKNLFSNLQSVFDAFNAE